MNYYSKLTTIIRVIVSLNLFSS